MEKELKEKTKLVFQYVKTLEEEKKSKGTSISSLFGEKCLQDLRGKLIELIESILWEDFEQISRKSREILWRKVYYSDISTGKKFFKKSGGNLSNEDSILLNNFIKDAICHYKTLILKFEDTFNLDLRFVIDFNIIANGAAPFEKRIEREIYTASEINHALETIHCFLISLGDLHRYCIDFRFDEVDYKSQAAHYYYEAFKLNPKNGMPHNQLGTLAGGENFEIESIFHYLYSLCSPQPAELSEANVNRIFQQNIESLEHHSSSSGDFSVKEFMQQVILVIDIFFYDKEIAEFNTLCYSVLLSFKEYLIKCRRNSQQDLTFQLTSIFMLCLLKLKMNNSTKIHSLNAFLIAFCAEIVNRTIEKLDEYVNDRKNEDLAFIDVYNRNFHAFEKKVRRARELSAHIKSTNVKEKDSGVEKNGSGSSNSLKEGHMSLSDPHSLSQPGQVKIVKRPEREVIKEPPPQETNKNAIKNRRRKRRGSTSSEESESESLFSENISMNSDFDSFDEDDDYLGKQFSSDDEDSDSDSMPISHESDGADFIIENEELIYNKDTDEVTEDFLIEEETFVFQDDQDEETMKLLKMKYKKKYSKVDPNLILQFCEKHSSWMQSLKILFDWLRLNTEILFDCYRSNPEFVTKVMKLINFINIDIFTRKIYFDRSMITMKNVREDLRSIFDSRHQIASSEDIVFKKFSLFEDAQQPIDWNLNYKLQITAEEDVTLRTFKIIDFGFHLCKQKKFNYNFCARNRVFIEKQKTSNRNRRDRNKNLGSKENNGGEKRRRNRNRNRNRDRKQKVSECDQFERLSIKTHSQESQQHEEFPTLQSTTRKGYLRSKVDEKKSAEDKSEMMGKMGKLWLKNEVQTLESRSKPVNANLTPYLMVDTLALINYLYIVKHLVKSKKFVLLIPKAVLQDIDGLKKSKEGARNAIKWLESEFQKGNRFMRTQRENELLTLPLLKIPSKLERDDTVFMNIVPFANFIVSNNNSNDIGSADIPVITLLTGDNLDSRKSTGINQAGILQSIPVKYEQINRFYSKYKK